MHVPYVAEALRSRGAMCLYSGQALSASLLSPLRCVVTLVNNNSLEPFKHSTIMMSVASQSPSDVSASKYKPLSERDAIRLVLLHPAAESSAKLEFSIEHGILSQYNQDLEAHIFHPSPASSQIYNEAILNYRHPIS
jgi:hypothetical protein